MSLNKRYYKIYNYKKIYLEFKPHLKQKIYVDSHVNNYINNSMKKYSNEELEVMKESTIKFKEHNSFETTVTISVLSAIFTLLAILVAVSIDKGLGGLSEAWLIITLVVYLLITVSFFIFALRKSSQIIRTANLLDIAIRLRKQEM